MVAAPTGAAQARHRRRRAAAGAVGVSMLLALWVLSDSLFGPAPTPAATGDAPVDVSVRVTGAPASAGSHAELEAALARQQCPPRATDGATPSVAFLHIPKTAGHFLQAFMKAAMPEEGLGRYCRKNKDFAAAAANLPCGVKGQRPAHWRLLSDLQANFMHRCSGFNAHQDYGFFQALGVDHGRSVTVVALRHPVERALSHYYFMLKIRDKRRSSFPFWPANDTDYSGLLEFASQQRRQANVQTYQLGGSVCSWPGAVPPARSEAALLARAKANMERFCVVVIAEFMDESLQLLGEAMGLSEATLLAGAGSLARTASNATPRPKVPLAVKRQLEAANYLDMQLYEHALRLFVRRAAAAAARTPGAHSMGDGDAELAAEVAAAAAVAEEHAAEAAGADPDAGGEEEEDEEEEEGAEERDAALDDAADGEGDE
ncbi:capsular polysaccharide biosynthesis [Micractinium conductrix]|uniref:Capsular polysaccharide biosynthesis n=1 Tax=Micractinium conductrix TaxID=554055 RepID=A0A2P6V6L7_9CHLO|nr:capsular polysaccharide biosynthesis [Micractinium conductrix]|eukprot:PSC69733.1 capsular polysaccharide biosynthesis [Micractinium conductrix]